MSVAGNYRMEDMDVRREISEIRKRLDRIETSTCNCELIEGALYYVWDGERPERPLVMYFVGYMDDGYSAVFQTASNQYKHKYDNWEPIVNGSLRWEYKEKTNE